MSTQETQAPTPETALSAEDVITHNPTLQETPEPDTELKQWLIGYVGDLQKPEDGNVTVEMIVETVASEFPEFLMAVAEENWVRGYYQAMVDVEEGTKAIREAVTSGRNPDVQKEGQFDDEQGEQRAESEDPE
tara:strand:+ start:718 stop:1116 length:399 start_codon:yes stop_codon:yes gene_type:complete